MLYALECLNYKSIHSQFKALQRDASDTVNKHHYGKWLQKRRLDISDYSMVRKFNIKNIIVNFLRQYFRQ